MDDPILKSYALCMKQGLLCAWARVKLENNDLQHPCEFSKFSKALWVFWYGSSDAPSISKCIQPELREEDHGNWKQGLSYEIRTILFKALHNVVDRYSCIIFAFLDVYLVRDSSVWGNGSSSRINVQYFTSFSFFLHGESTVCVSLDIRQLPRVQSIGIRHLNYCARNQVKLPVVLAPYGISAQLIGFPTTRKEPNEIAEELDVWLQFYPLVFDSDENKLGSVPHGAGPTGVQVPVSGSHFSTPNKQSSVGIGVQPPPPYTTRSAPLAFCEGFNTRRGGVQNAAAAIAAVAAAAAASASVPSVFQQPFQPAPKFVEVIVGNFAFDVFLYF
ncbi:unnamed protein product [Protopolystoma xenopodis]|uniref:Mediator of RNA polymerase II transcription subunit 13 n=1 Tax=Protopolystoma xenopodis TaxID=117903 RepID=A0A3S5A0T5_9PLAT|nr:unnamed protein product [Protopolystoma xenopodis]